jgi:hypothetical protein
LVNIRPVTKKEISAKVSDGSLTASEKSGGTKKKFRQRKAMTDTTADDKKSPVRDCSTTIIR